jgi:hypothetical protein
MFSGSFFTPADEVECLKYQVRVYEGMMDAIHGGGHMLTEVFIPSPYNICINKVGSFRRDKPRNATKENTENFFSRDIETPTEKVRISRADADGLLDIVNQQEALKTREKEIRNNMRDIVPLPTERD